MIDTNQLAEQMKQSRVRDGRFERLENGEWVVWPVLRLDKWAHDETKRIVTRNQSREDHDQARR